MIKNLISLLTKKDQLSFLILIIVFSLFSVLDIIGLYLLSQGISGIFNPIYIDIFLDNFKKIEFLQKISFKEFYLLIFFFFLAKNILFYLFYYFQSIFITKVSTNIASNLYKYSLQSTYLKFLSLDIAETSKNLTADISRSVQLISCLNTIVKESFLLLLIFLVIFLINQNFFISLLILVLVLVIIFRFLYSKKLKIYGAHYQTYSHRQVKRILDSFNLFIEIKLYNLVNFFFNRFKNETFNKEFNEQKLNFIVSVPRLIIEVFVVTLLYLFIVFYKIENINDYIPLFSLLIILSLRSIPSIISLNRAYFDLNFFSSSLSSLILKFKKINFEKKTETLNRKSDYKDFNFKRDIIFKNISYGYKKNNDILKKINFKIKKNDIVGIVGNSGSGKTTLLLLLFGFIKPNSGKIVIDGLNLDKIVNNWRNCISYAPQDTILIGESLMQNITFRDEISKSDEIRLKSSLSISNSKNFLNSKYKSTIIEEKGLNFSGGQRKRLGLARALFLKKDIYIFDEPTSFLDNNTINKVFNNLKNFFLNKTVIIISHNEDCLKFCNKIYYLRNKKIFLKKNN